MHRRTLNNGQRETLQEGKANNACTDVHPSGQSRTEYHADNKGDEIRQANEPQRRAARLGEQEGEHHTVEWQCENTTEQ